MHAILKFVLSPFACFDRYICGCVTFRVRYISMLCFVRLLLFLGSIETERKKEKRKKARSCCCRKHPIAYLFLALIRLYYSYKTVTLYHAQYFWSKLLAGRHRIWFVFAPETVDQLFLSIASFTSQISFKLCIRLIMVV